MTLEEMAGESGAIAVTTTFNIGYTLSHGAFIHYKDGEGFYGSGNSLIEAFDEALSQARKHYSKIKHIGGAQCTAQ